MQHASTTSSIPTSSTVPTFDPRAGVLQTIAGSPTHQILAFLRHPHLRCARPIDDGDEAASDAHPKEQASVTLVPQVIAESLGSRLRIQGALQRGQALHVILAAASVLHYLLQNGWSIGRLSVDDIMIAVDGDVLFDVAAQATPCSIRTLNNSELTKITTLGDRLLAQGLGSPQERAQERAVIGRLLAGLEHDEDLDRAATLAGCIEIGRPMKFNRVPSFSNELLQVSEASPGPAAERAGRRRRRSAAERSLRPVMAVQRVRVVLGTIDGLLERFVDQREQRAHAASVSAEKPTVVKRLLSPTAMATALSAVAIVWLVLTS